MLDPPVPGSEQFNLQQRRAIETSGASLVDLALLQQRGMFALADDPSAALTPIAPPNRTITIVKLRARLSIPRELYLAGQTAVKRSLVIFDEVGVFPGDEAWVVAGVIAAVLIFVIPERGKQRQPKDLIIMLVSVIGVYAIYLKLGNWLATLIDPRIAKAATILLLFLFLVSLLVPNLRRGTKLQTPDAD